MKNKNHFIYLFISTLLYSLCAVISIALSVFLGQIIDSATAGSLSTLLRLVIICACSFVVYLVSVRVGIFFRMKYVSLKMADYKNDILYRISESSIVEYQKNNQAFYLNCLTGDSDKIEEDYYCSIPRIAFCICTLITSLGVLIYINWLLLILYCVFFIISFIIPQTYTNIVKKQQTNASTSNEQFINNLKEFIEGWETIKLNNCSSFFYNNISQKVQHNIKSHMLLRGANAFVAELNTISGSFSQLACIAIGGYMVITDHITVGDLIISIQLVQFIFESISEIGTKITAIRAVQPIISKVKEICIPKQNYHNNDKNAANTCSNIKYQNVSFSFDHKQIITDFSLSINAGETCAIIGESGRGKSTLVKLLMKYHQNYKGQILIDNNDINTIPDTILYEKVKYVSQEPYLFNDSIINNIVMYRDVNEEVIKKAIIASKLEELIEEYGNSPIGDFGDKLSGGERQRIALARALISSPDLIIFDEPTSALDPQTANEILDNICMLNNVTRIVITHIWDEKVLKRFDNIIKL